MSYTCERCGYEAVSKTHYVRHLNSKTPCNTSKKDVSREGILEKLTQERERKCEAIVCEWCNKTFAKKNSARHKLSCRSKPVQPQEQSERYVTEDRLLHLKDEIRKQLIQELAGSSNNTFINNTNNNTTNNLVININSFGAETYDHITPDFVKTCLLNNVPGLKTLIERIHFSDEAPLNKNVRHKSLKNKLVEVVKDDKWVVKDAHETADTLITKGCRIMTRHYYEDEDIQDTDLNEYDHRIQQSLLQMNDRGNPQYFACRKRILALINEYT